ncbi:MAG: gliding motility protein GldM [Bacteroidales bacterium]|nr:gliding motility protein GldM [Bacteroidales bacterium]
MAHGKETPRQKMIGMMYLVLTALLALNVRKDVLDAFVLVDEGLVKTTENFFHKNDLLYTEFQSAAAENPQKAKKWLDKALEVQQRSNDLCTLIEDLKVEILKTAEKSNFEKVVVDNKIVGEEIKTKDNYDIPSQIMVGDNNDGKGFELKNVIVKHREFLLDLVAKTESNKSVISSIEENLNTSDPPAKEGEQQTWETEHFEHLPLIAVITLMSKMQGDIRNAESDILRYLYSQIDAGSFKFNKLEPTVIPNSNYIIRGNEYYAEVFIAASDTTQDPIILVGPYDSSEVSDGVYEYFPKKDYVYDTIPINPHSKKGEYVIKPTSSAIWGGLIQIASPTGGVISQPFKKEYQVVEPSLTVSPTKMNMFYLGVDNPVDIAVPGVTSDKVFPSINNGRIYKSGKGYIVNPSRVGTAQVNITAEVNGAKKSMGAKEFRVEKLPDPYPAIKGLKRGVKVIKQTQLLASGAGVEAQMPDGFAFNITYRITEYELIYTVRGLTQRKTNKGANFEAAVQQAIQNMGRGEVLFLSGIKVVGPDGIVRDIGSISVTLQ